MNGCFLHYYQVRISKRIGKQVKVLESEDPETQQLLRTIQLQEKANQHKKRLNVAKQLEKQKERIEGNEMPLKIRVKSKGKSRGSLPKESIRLRTILPIDTPVKVPEKTVIIF